MYETSDEDSEFDFGSNDLDYLSQEEDGCTRTDSILNSSLLTSSTADELSNFEDSGFHSNEQANSSNSNSTKNAGSICSCCSTSSDDLRNSSNDATDRNPIHNCTNSNADRHTDNHHPIDLHSYEDYLNRLDLTVRDDLIATLKQYSVIFLFNNIDCQLKSKVLNENHKLIEIIFNLPLIQSNDKSNWSPMMGEDSLFNQFNPPNELTMIKLTREFLELNHFFKQQIINQLIKNHQFISNFNLISKAVKRCIITENNNIIRLLYRLPVKETETFVEQSNNLNKSIGCNSQQPPPTNRIGLLKKITSNTSTAVIIFPITNFKEFFKREQKRISQKFDCSNLKWYVEVYSIMKNRKHLQIYLVCENHSSQPVRCDVNIRFSLINQDDKENKVRTFQHSFSRRKEAYGGSICEYQCLQDNGFIKNNTLTLRVFLWTN